MRNCNEVINQIIAKIPSDKTDFIEDLEWIRVDYIYKAPEETLHWTQTSGILICNIPKPKEDWEFEVLSIFTTKSINEIKEHFQNLNNE